MPSKTALCLIFGASLNLGCTFITSCPTPTNTNPATGGSNGGGGTNGNPDGEGGSPGDDGVWVNVTSNLASLVSIPGDACRNAYPLTSKPGENLVIVGVGAHGLWATSDKGETWDELGTGEGSEPIPHLPTAVVYDPDNSDVFWESGIYDSGIFKTEDHGVTFQQVGTLRHTELVSIDFSDPERKVIVAGGHEQRAELHRSQDGGMTFESIGDKLPREAGVSSFPHVLDASTYLLGTQNFGGGITGIFRTTDAGDSWTKVAEGGGIWKPLVASDGTLYWAGENGAPMLRSEDQGLTWEPTKTTSAVFSLSPVELPDGRIASVSTRYVVVSDDKGETWHPVSPPLPFPPRSMTYSPEQQAFYISHETCASGTDDTLMRYDFDYAAE